ncbi:hypothetical protein [Actinokineospora enzanensis]|uniref:hypothetical protein n=1 Tax=Actinokineospora enzanensis TaxID=155975 RepID=UPI00035F078C|nr:hypothetical protein [Actinokineospora enzanensis]
MTLDPITQAHATAASLDRQTITLIDAWTTWTTNLDKLVRAMPLAAAAWYLGDGGEKRVHSLLLPDGHDPRDLRAALNGVLARADAITAALTRTATHAHRMTAEWIAVLTEELDDHTPEVTA